MITEIGLGISSDSWRFRIGWNSEFMGLVPGECESGMNSPANSFDAPSERYWKWGWLWFVIFFIEARP